ncbi:NAD-binding protein [Plesiomonas shigelloides]|nr:NAD-binding protein [Plesiomonas shigelloides]
MLIIGGGPIACEIGQALSELGSQVSLVQQSERLLMKEDPQASALVAQALRDSGVHLYTHSQVLSCQREGKRRILQIKVLMESNILCVAICCWWRPDVNRACTVTASRLSD